MLLITTDSDMQFTHKEEIKANREVAILATGNKKGSMTEWVKALVDMKIGILKYWKNQERPCFATFNRDAKFATKKTIKDSDYSRRNRPREQEQRTQEQAS